MLSTKCTKICSNFRLKFVMRIFYGNNAVLFPRSVAPWRATNSRFPRDV